MFKLKLVYEDDQVDRYVQSIDNYGDYRLYQTDGRRKKIVNRRETTLDWGAGPWEQLVATNPFGAVDTRTDTNRTWTVTATNPHTRTVTLGNGHQVQILGQAQGIRPPTDEPIQMNHVEAMAEQVRQMQRAVDVQRVIARDPNLFNDEDVPF